MSTKEVLFHDLLTGKDVSKFERLCQYLDSNNDWKEFATELDLPMEIIYRYEDSKKMNPEFSPSTVVLLSWAKKAKTVFDTVALIRRAENEIAARYLESWTQEKVAKKIEKESSAEVPKPEVTKKGLEDVIQKTAKLQITEKEQTKTEPARQQDKVEEKTNENNAGVSDIKQNIIKKAKDYLANPGNEDKKEMIRNYLAWIEKRQELLKIDEDVLDAIIFPTPVNISHILQHLLDKSNKESHLLCGKVDVTDLDTTKPIGNGSFATCYRSKYQGKPAAVKSFNRNLSTLNHSEKFCSECTLMWILRHPRIVELYGYTVVDGYHCLVMELMDTNLDNWLQKNGSNITFEQCVNFSLQIAEGLQFLHAAHAIHRDICDSNILIKNDSEAKISDVGEAEPSKGSQNPAGHDDYMSPEEIMKNQEIPDRPYSVQKEADMWKFGLVLLRIFSKGKFKPHLTDTLVFKETMKTGKEELPTEMDPKSYSEDQKVVQLITKCLRFDPSTRLTAGQAVEKLAKLAKK